MRALGLGEMATGEADQQEGGPGRQRSVGAGQRQGESEGTSMLLEGPWEGRSSLTPGCPSPASTHGNTHTKTEETLLRLVSGLISESFPLTFQVLMTSLFLTFFSFSSLCCE